MVIQNISRWSSILLFSLKVKRLFCVLMRSFFSMLLYESRMWVQKLVENLKKMQNLLKFHFQWKFHQENLHQNLQLHKFLKISLSIYSFLQNQSSCTSFVRNASLKFKKFLHITERLATRKIYLIK